jgi:hypothetical protein
VRSLLSPLPTSAGRLGRLFAVVALFAAVGPSRGETPPADPGRFAFDKDRFYVRNIHDLQPLRLEGDDDREPFEDVLLHAHSFPADDLAAAARRDLSVSDLSAKDKAIRDELRFELVHVEGKLKRLKRIPALGRLKAAGIDDVYEAWIFPRTGRTTDPVCVYLTRRPEGVEPADDFTPGVPVVTAAYYFKLLEYESNQPNPKDPNRSLFRRAPLLLGQTLTTTAETPPDNASLTDLVTLSLVFGGVVLAGLVGLAVWLRRSDGGSRRAATHRLRNPYTPPPDAPPAPPADQPT